MCKIAEEKSRRCAQTLFWDSLARIVFVLWSRWSQALSAHPKAWVRGTTDIGDYTRSSPRALCIFISKFKYCFCFPCHIICQLSPEQGILQSKCCRKSSASLSPFPAPHPHPSSSNFVNVPRPRVLLRSISDTASRQRRRLYREKDTRFAG